MGDEPPEVDKVDKGDEGDEGKFSPLVMPYDPERHHNFLHPLDSYSKGRDFISSIMHLADSFDLDTDDLFRLLRSKKVIKRDPFMLTENIIKIRYIITSNGEPAYEIDSRHGTMFLIGEKTMPVKIFNEETQELEERLLPDGVWAPTSMKGKPLHKLMYLPYNVQTPALKLLSETRWLFRLEDVLEGIKFVPLPEKIEKSDDPIDMRVAEAEARVLWRTNQLKTAFNNLAQAQNTLRMLKYEQKLRQISEKFQMMHEQKEKLRANRLQAELRREKRFRESVEAFRQAYGSSEPDPYPSDTEASSQTEE